jgi:carnosine synthase
VLTRQQQEELIQLSVAATLALGFTCGVFHVESKYTSHGARLIEVNCRYASTATLRIPQAC